MKLVRFLDGSLVEFNVDNEEDLLEQVSTFVDNPTGLVQLIPFGADTYHVLIHPDRRLLILNRTQGNFFCYHRKYFNDEGYISIVASLCLSDLAGDSHWMADDHIVFVPSHLNDYVKAMYGELNV